MLPTNGLLSVTPQPAPFVDPSNAQGEPLVDHEMGGAGLNDPSQGLRVQLWTASYDGTSVLVSAPNTPNTVMFSKTGVTQVALAFDQNMRPFIAFVDALGAHYWWFDTIANAQVFTDLPVGSETPRACLDDSRQNQRGISDIILAYVSAGTLYYRQQRDAYAIDHVLSSALPCGGFQAIGMNEKLCLQFRFGGGV